MVILLSAPTDEEVTGLDPSESDPRLGNVSPSDGPSTWEFSKRELEGAFFHTKRGTREVYYPCWEIFRTIVPNWAQIARRDERKFRWLLRVDLAINFRNRFHLASQPRYMTVGCCQLEQWT